MTRVSAEYGDTVEVKVRGPVNPGVMLNTYLLSGRPGSDTVYMTPGQAERLHAELGKAIQEARGDR